MSETYWRIRIQGSDGPRYWNGAGWVRESHMAQVFFMVKRAHDANKYLPADAVVVRVTVRRGNTDDEIRRQERERCAKACVRLLQSYEKAMQGCRGDDIVVVTGIGQMGAALACADAIRGLK